MKLTLIATAAAAAVGVADAGDLISCTASYMAHITGPCGAASSCASDPAVVCPTVCPDGCQATIDQVHVDCGGVMTAEGDSFDLTTQPALAIQVATYGCRCAHLHSPHKHNTPHTPPHTT